MSLTVSPSPSSSKKKTMMTTQSLSSSSSSMVPRRNNTSTGNNKSIDFMGSIPTIQHLLTFQEQEQHEERDVAIALHNVGNGTLILEDASNFLPTATDTNDSAQSSGTIDWNYQNWKFQLHSTPKLITHTDNTTNDPSLQENDNNNNNTGLMNSMMTNLEQEDNNELKESYADVVLKKKETIPYSLQTMIVPGIDNKEQEQMLLEQFDQATTIQKAPSDYNVSVLDSYLDTLLTNVPQLAYSLQQKGFHSLNPSSSLSSSTTTSPQTAETSTLQQQKQMFSKVTVDTNANMLLHFLKSNCTSANTTYLLYKHSKSKSLQLYNISSLSIRGKAKWVWWLATLSNRFASRLKQFSPSNTNIRQAQRNLLWNALELFQEFADLQSQQQQQQQQTSTFAGGGKHQSLCASVCEQLADTYLVDKTMPSQTPSSSSTSSSINKYPKEKKNGNENQSIITAPSSSLPVIMISSFIDIQRYMNVNVDGLTKATDHLMKAIHYLNQPSFSSDISRQQLNNVREKLIHVSIQLTQHYLKHYVSSSVMQTLRTSARTLSKLTSDNSTNYQCWLWELCGHFARSFAADELWRDRGHTCGDDILSLLQEIHDTAMNQSKKYSHTDSNDNECHASSSTALSFDQLNILFDPNKKNKNIISFEMDADGIKKDFIDNEKAWKVAEKILEQQIQLKRDKQRVLVAAVICYSRAIYAFQSSSSSNNNNNRETIVLYQRLGDACNEIGKLLLLKTKEFVASSSKNIEQRTATGPFIVSAQQWFLYGLKQFEKCHDFRNVALLRCNLSQCSKIQMTITTSNNQNSEACLEEAADHLEKAHAYLEGRDLDNYLTWDMVSEELAATFLVLGVRRRQTLLGGGGTTTPLSSSLSFYRLTPGKERSIVDPMERAKDIYKTLGNHHQAAAASYQLALFYSKIWTCQRDEKITRQKLSAAFQFFSEAHQFFFQHMRGNEPTFIILCLDLSNLYSAVSHDMDCLSKSLLCCLDTTDAFSSEAILTARKKQHNDKNDEWFSKMKTLEKSMEERIFKLLMNLVKLEKAAATTATTKTTNERQMKESYENLYREALILKMSYTNNKMNGLSSFHHDKMEDDNIEQFFVHHILLLLKEGKVKMEE